jgi:hypothetical protein
MFTTCIHCNSDLGRNEAFETFPVGTRLAFDAAHGRLWVVCRACARWNLSPLDERWETIEAAERRFRDSRLRVSTDNVGLARLREGVDLIRIGEPQRPEMAAWRYGDQFGTRRKRQMLITGAVVGSATVIAGGMIWIGISFASCAGIYANNTFLDSLIHGRPGTIVGRIALPDGSIVDVRRKHARMSTLERSPDGERLALRLESASGTHLLLGDDAQRAAARLMPVVNRFGGSKAQVQEAVTVLEEIGDPRRVLQTLQLRHGASETSERWKRVATGFYRNTEQVKHVHGALHTLRPHERLALEMALHEESERRAMDGELAQLEAAWREAEEIAKVADTMLVLPSVDARLDEMRLRTLDPTSFDRRKDSLE